MNKLIYRSKSLSSSGALACLAAWLVLANIPAKATVALPALDRARSWAGAKSLSALQSLEITSHRATVRWQFRLRLPDQFQTRYLANNDLAFDAASPEQFTANTLDGRTFWQKFPNPLPPEVKATAERGAMTSFTAVAMTFLLAVPSQKADVKDTGNVELVGLAGAGVVVTASNGVSTTFIFGLDDGRLLGYVEGTTRSGALRGTPRVAVSLDDFRVVDGVRMPYRVTEHWDDGRVTVVDVDRIRANVVSAADFRRSK